jgi:hypothetical protein
MMFMPPASWRVTIAYPPSVSRGKRAITFFSIAPPLEAIISTASHSVRTSCTPGGTAVAL